MELISVIIPAYNNEKYLPKCLDSIINQTYKNIEILLIDDGSTNNCGKICDEYAKKDLRIKVIHKENGGVGSARNCGLDNANGEYIVFVDSDDYVENDYISYLYSALEKDIDLVYMPFNLMDESGAIKNEKEKHKYEQIVFIDDKYDVKGLNEHNSVCGVLFKKSMLYDLRFDTSLFVGEDTLFYMSYIKKCKKIKFVPEKKYNYIVYQSSSCHGEYSEKKYTEIIAWKKIVELFSDMPHACESCRSMLAHTCYNMYLKMYVANSNDENKINYVIATLKENYKYMYRFKFKNKERLQILLLLFFRKLFNKVFSIYKKVKGF